jgi:hypothetical protein
MSRIKLYNAETNTHKGLFAAVLHQLLQRQYPEARLVEPTVSPADDDFPFTPVDTEHLVLLKGKEVVYGRTYLAVGVSPETAVNHRLNQIRRLPDNLGSYKLKRAIFAVNVEGPRACLPRIDETGEMLGKLGVQFEFWEAKDVRRQIAARLGVDCPAFGPTHLSELAKIAGFGCSLLPKGVGPGDEGAVEKDTAESLEKLGTLFISYASEDRTFVERLVEALDRYAANVWYDKREVVAGESIAQKINAALSEASALIAVMSPASVDKPWVLRELSASLGRQLQSHAIKVLPVVVEQCDLPPLIADIRYADFTESFEKGFNDLLAGLQGRRAYSLFD